MKENSAYRWIVLLVLVAACKQAYEPPAIKTNHNYLVVDGVINTLPDSETTIRLSRTRNLTDTIITSPETGASLQIEAKSGATYQLLPQDAGVYSIDHLSLNPNDLYRLRIVTSGGGQYLSDFVPAKQTPPIDSLSWKQNEDVTIYASTHDPSNQARYYRWDYLETWHYKAFLETNYGLGVSNGIIFFRDDTNQINNCWQTLRSTEIVLASSLRLSEDVIDRFPVAVIPKNDSKLDIRYSILVRQYALTEDAYHYWDIVRKNSQTLGTLFDAQPGQLTSNIRNLANPSEPVLGFVSACRIEEKRLFISNAELFNWKSPPLDHFCQVQSISQDPVNPLRWNYSDTSFSPWYFLSPAGIMIAKTDCIDCRRKGGTNYKPSFW
jgi:hypothetical protein